MTVRRSELRRRPAAVRHNDWRQVELPDPGAFAPTLAVSVIVPCFEAPEALALTLAGLERQIWPPELLEVVVVDDGSDPPLVRPARSPLDLKVVRQERRGFGLARARNTGVGAAAHDILVFLDGDVIPEAGLVSAHARWHHAISDALTLGFCAYVSAAGIGAGAVRAHRGRLGELFAGRAADPPWLERHMARTDDLTSRHGDLFRAVTGLLGISRALFEEAGGYDESFTRYGGEDTEFGWRAQVLGGLLVPERGAFGWHQGRWAEGREGKEREAALQAEKLAGLIAEPGFRPAAPGRRFAVPRHVVTLDAGRDGVERVIEAARTLLADPAGDVGLCVEVPPRRGADPVRERLGQEFGEDPAVRIVPAGGALEAFPASPLHIVVPARAVTVPGLPARRGAAAAHARPGRRRRPLLAAGTRRPRSGRSRTLTTGEARHATLENQRRPHRRDRGVCRAARRAAPRIPRAVLAAPPRRTRRLARPAPGARTRSRRGRHLRRRTRRRARRPRPARRSRRALRSARRGGPGPHRRAPQRRRGRLGMNAETGRAAGRRDRPKRARTPRGASVETLPATWRTQAKALRRYGGETPAVALESCAAELEATLRERDETTLSLTEAARESGYSADHLGRLVRDGRIPNAGRPGAPRIARRHLPRKTQAPATPLLVEKHRRGEVSNAQIVQSIIEGGIE